MRTHYCGQVNETLTGQEVTVAGWVHRRRDHGGVIFVDLRDREGLLQIVFDPDAPEVFAEAERLRSEFVVRVRGLVRARPAGTANANLASGQVEVLARELELLNRSEPLPFQLDETVNEEVRLKYRYLDLRRDVMTLAPAPASPGHARDARVPRRQRLHRSRNADAHQGDAGRRARLPRAEPHASGQVLRAAAVAADLQAAADDVGLRSLLPDRALLPRRGPARRPPAGIHPARHRDFLPRRSRDHGADGRADPPALQGRARRSSCPIRSRA